MDARMVALGGLMLAASSLTLVAIGPLVARTPLSLAAGLFLVMAVASLLVDRRWHDRLA